MAAGHGHGMDMGMDMAMMDCGGVTTQWAVT